MLTVFYIDRVEMQRNMGGYESPCRARAAEPELPSQLFNFVFFSEQWHMNLYLCCYIVAWTEFMDIFGRLSHGREFRLFYRFAWNKTY